MLGKRLNIGETFVTTTKRQIKMPNKVGYGWKASIKPKAVGSVEYFQKGKRKYLCEVRGIIETRTGIFPASFINTTNYTDPVNKGVRYWQFSYLLKVLES